MSSFACSRIRYVCGIKRVQGGGYKDSKGGLRLTSCKMGQLTCSTGQEWMEILILVSKATSASKVSLSKNQIYLNPDIFKPL
jgi:hypothetical protein